jgi:hypothetical protein
MSSRGMSNGQSMMLQQSSKNIASGFIGLKIWDIADYRENKWFMGLSFETISSTGANAGKSPDLRMTC